MWEKKKEEAAFLLTEAQSTICSPLELLNEQLQPCKYVQSTVYYAACKALMMPTELIWAAKVGLKARKGEGRNSLNLIGCLFYD